jgi:putative flavoprotein involved in K+ transport
VPEAVVVGAGPGGLAAAAMLQRTGVETVVVDRAPAVASTWHGHYDRLHLHTVRWLSHLPGYRIPRRYGRWVARDDVVRYLESYCAHHRLDVCLNTEVTSIDRVGDSWVVRTVPRAGERSNDGIGDLQARYVVVATGHNDTPVMPDWPGVDAVPGELVHASDYRNATPYVGRSVLVVGSGNTGAEIAVDLVESGAREVAIAVRTPPHIVLREKYGVPSLALGVLFRHLPPRVFDPIAAAIRRMDVGDLTAYGLPTPKDGLYERIRRDDAIPLIDVGFLRQLKAGRIVVVPAVDGFQGGHVLLADGSRRRADVVIAATGYRRGLRPLVGHLGLLDDDDRPRVRGGATDPAAPRMWFTGFTNPISGMFRELGIDAKRIARAVVLDRSQARPGSPLVDVLRVSAPGVLPGREPVRS